MSASLGSIRPIQTPKTAELVARHVRRYIVDARIEAGTRLPSEAELSARYTVSRTTIREAVRILEAEGLVERGTRQAPCICVPGPEIVSRPASLLLAARKVPLSDVITAWRAIEDSAVVRAASERSETVTGALQSVLEDEPEIAYGDVEALVGKASQFHRTLVGAAGGITLELLVDTLHHLLKPHAEMVCGSVIRKDPAEFGRGYGRLRRSYGRLARLIRTGDFDEVTEHWNAHWSALEALLLVEDAGVEVVDILP